MSYMKIRDPEDDIQMLVQNESCSLDYRHAKCVDIPVKNLNNHLIVPNTSYSKCKMCNSPEIKSSIPITTKSPSEQPYYLCTVTCCNSANCVEASNMVLAKSISPKPVNLYDYGCLSCPVTPEPNLSEMRQLISESKCAICNKTQQAKSRIILPNITRNAEPEYINKIDRINSNETQPQNIIPNCKPTTQTSVSVNPVCKNEACIIPVKRTPRKESLNRNTKLQIYMSNEKNRLHSPELSSSPQGNSSYTEYTDIYTPMCTSVNSNQTDNNHFKFSVEGKPSPLNSDYQFYFAANVGNHGFFRKAVPALPVAVAVLLCILNLILPGSGTLLASLTIIFGFQTEYGSGYECRAFIICFLSAILQFVTAIFVFGWVWSIMWGIVFIKNSLRYGERRSIYTMSLC